MDAMIKDIQIVPDGQVFTLFIEDHEIILTWNDVLDLEIAARAVRTQIEEKSNAVVSI
jgi:hypothetical protein